MDKELTDNEKVLLQAIACWLRGEMVSQLQDYSPSPELLDDRAQTNYEISCNALDSVGLFAYENRFYRVREPENDQTVFAGQHTRGHLDQLLDGLVAHSDYVSDLRRHDEFFTPTERALYEVCQAMAECGYMTALSEKTFEWGEALGPWLVSHRVWDLNDYEVTPQEEIDRVLKIIPSEVKVKLSESGFHWSFSRIS